MVNKLSCFSAVALSKSSVQFTLDLHNKGAFKGFRSVIELGSQDLNFKPRTALLDQLKAGLKGVEPAKVEAAFQKALAASTPDEFRVGWLYELMGMAEYSCVDADGRYGAQVWDLNVPIPEEHRGRYDLVTDHGTLEHVFNVFQGFKNVHDLAHPGSVMIHYIPFQANVDHGFFNFQPVLFDDLANENRYEVLERSAIVFTVKDDLEHGTKIIPYTKPSFRELFWQEKFSEAMYAVALRKTTDEEFRAPFHGIYGSTCLIPSYRSSLAQQWGQKLMAALFRDPQSLPRRAVKAVKGLIKPS